MYHLVAANAWGWQIVRDLGFGGSDTLEKRASHYGEADKTRAPEAIYNQEDKNYVFY